MRTCATCGGAIFGFNEVVGYAGPICGCHRNPLYSGAGWEIAKLHTRIAELENDLRRVEGQRNSSNRMIVQLQDELAGSQAKIDALMLEHCHKDMTPEQLEEWGANQVPVVAVEDPCKDVCLEGAVCRTPACKRLVSGYGYGPKEEDMNG